MHNYYPIAIMKYTDISLYIVKSFIKMNLNTMETQSFLFYENESAFESHPICDTIPFNLLSDRISSEAYKSHSGELYCCKLNKILLFVTF